MDDGFQWALEIDLDKLFGTFSHDKLTTFVIRDVKNGEIVSLIRKFLVSGIMILSHNKDR